MKDLNTIVFTIFNKNSKMRVLENGILHTVFLKESILEVEDVKEMKRGYESLPDPKPNKAIQEFEAGVSMSPKCRIYAAEHSPDLLGVAYIINGLPQRLLIHFYVKMWKRKKPVKVFQAFDEALVWLNTI